MRRSAVVLVAVLTITSCQSSVAAPTTSSSVMAPVSTVTVVTTAPPTTVPTDPQTMIVRSELDEVEVEPWVWCIGPDPAACHMSEPPELPIGLVTAGEVLMSFPTTGWFLVVELCRGGVSPCLDSEQMEPVPDGDHWRVDLPDPAAMWAVTLHGENEGGSVSYTFATLPGDWG